MTGAELAVLALPTILNFFGGVLDDTDEARMEEMARQFNLKLPLMKGQAGLQGAGVFADLLGQQKGLMGDVGRGQGFGAAAGFPTQ